MGLILFIIINLFVEFMTIMIPAFLDDEGDYNLSPLNLYRYCVDNFHDLTYIKIIGYFLAIIIFPLWYLAFAVALGIYIVCLCVWIYNNFEFDEDSWFIKTPFKKEK